MEHIFLQLQKGREIQQNYLRVTNIKVIGKVMET